jgi:hypothetical protein
MPNREDVLRDETYKGKFETVGERVYATLMNAKRMGPQLTAKTVALVVQSLHKHKLLSDDEVDELLIESVKR